MHVFRHEREHMGSEGQKRRNKESREYNLACENVFPWDKVSQQNMERGLASMEEMTVRRTRGHAIQLAVGDVMCLQLANEFDR